MLFDRNGKRPTDKAPMRVFGCQSCPVPGEFRVELIAQAKRQSAGQDKPSGIH